MNSRNLEQRHPKLYACWRSQGSPGVFSEWAVDYLMHVLDGLQEELCCQSKQIQELENEPED